MLPIVLVQGSLTIQVRPNGIFRRDSGWITCHCILSTKGYLMIYAKEYLLKGYAVNLSRAKKLNVSCERLLNKDGIVKVYF